MLQIAAAYYEKIGYDVIETFIDDETLTGYAASHI